MRPVLFEIFGFQIPTYGAILVASFLVALFFLRKETPRMGMDADKVADVAIMGLLFGLIGAKVLLIFVDLPTFIQDPKRLLGTIRSAGVIYGGLLGGTAGMLWYMRRHKLSPWRTLDVMAPFAALGVGLGRLSCVMVGCCHGVVYDGPLALVFPDHPLCEAPAGIGLFPVQLVGMVNGIILSGFLLFLLRKHYKFEGQIILAFMGLYGLTRGLIEFLRGDTIRGVWLGGTISTSQLISIVGIAVAIILYSQRSKTARLQDHSVKNH